ncbi:MAG: acyl-CoA dehydrogenase [Flavobacteriales bacterium]|jgi:alkylation response protein AidB-like acyl-CoA dehydrogenase|nr:acyl-CoA dehydrogenase [Flavobacteriales bacterium]|tara:strand:+ start:4098 stop:5861 length:1764 start_codon:yes stop_codon:yes gene_type:complete
MIKGGEFIIKDQKKSEIFIPEDFKNDQIMMANATTEFVKKELDIFRVEFENKNYKLCAEKLKKAGKLGLLGISIPEKYGGMGLPFTTSVLICDKISGANGSFSTAYGAHTGIGTLPILLYGDEKQKQKYLPNLATGEWIGCYCLTEPGAGSDANAGKTAATLSSDKKNYTISGQKMWISNAGYADIFIVFAKIENDKNITAFILEKSMNGITLGEEERKLGLNSSSTRQVFLNDVEVPVTNLLGGRGKGFKIAMNALNIGRIKLSAAVIEACKRSISSSTKYANQRIQFGNPISKYGAIKQKLAEMASNTFAVESSTYRASYEIEKNIKKLISEGVNEQQAHLKGVEEFAIECSITKILGSETVQFCTDEGIQILGGMGYSADTPMEAAFRDARISRIYEGTNEINRLLIVAMLLKKSLKGKINLMEPAMKLASEIMSIPSSEEDDKNDLLFLEKSSLKKLKKLFLVIAGKTIETYGLRIEEEQEIMMHLADMCIEIYTAESCLLRTDKIKSNEKQKFIHLSQVYMYKSIKKCQNSAEEIIFSFQNLEEKKLLLLATKRFTKGYTINIKETRRKVANKLIEENQYCF